MQKPVRVCGNIFFGMFAIHLVIGIWLAGCSREKPAEEIIRISGSTTVLPIVAKTAERFTELNQNVKITVSPGGSGVGIRSVAAGLATIGMVSREISPEELKNYPDVDFVRHPIARDAVACAISSEVYEAGLNKLSKGQIRAIYSGEIENWRAVGGPDQEILCIDKESHRGTRHVFMGFIFGDENAVALGADLVTGSNNEEQSKIALSDTAIGMLSIPWLNQEVRGVGIEVDGVVIEPSIENVRKGVYPISRDLLLITRGEPTGTVLEYIQFVLSAEGQRVVEESGYVAIGS